MIQYAVEEFIENENTCHLGLKQIAELAVLVKGLEELHQRVSISKDGQDYLFRLAVYRDQTDLAPVDLCYKIPSEKAVKLIPSVEPFKAWIKRIEDFNLKKLGSPGQRLDNPTVAYQKAMDDLAYHYSVPFEKNDISLLQGPSGAPTCDIRTNEKLWAVTGNKFVNMPIFPITDIRNDLQTELFEKAWAKIKANPYSTELL